MYPNIFVARFPFLIVLITAWLSLLAPVMALGKTDTITWGGSNDRTGYQTNHNMDPAIVGSPQFGFLFKTLLPGTYTLSGQSVREQIFSQPLVYTGSDGVQYVYIATTLNNIYKMNAKTGVLVASRNLHRPFLVSDLDGCTDINPLVGVTATGVIDPATDTWHLTSKTYLDQSLNGANGRPNGRYYIHAVSTADLTERTNFPINIEGLVPGNNPLRLFQAGIHHQRPGLLQYGRYVYAGFASHCAQYNFTGWIIGWEKSSGQIVEQFTTEGAGVAASVPGGGVWMSGGGISSDNKGSMFFGTGNGYASQLNGIPVNGRSPPTALEEAAVHMAINDDGSLNIVDFFMPWEKTQLDGADKDLGTTPLELLPSQFQCGGITRMGVITGKSGKTYFLNLDDLGGYSNGPNKQDKVVEVYQNENSVYSGAGVYPLEGGYIYISVIQYPTHVFKFSCNNGVASFDKVADSPENNAYVLGVGHGTTTSLDGQPGTGLLWTSDVEGANLRIYNAVPSNGQLTLINSFVTPGVTKFTRPVFGDGTVYQGTTLGYIYAYGSPVNLVLNCTSLQFGNVNINATSSAMTVQCQANSDLTVTAAALAGNLNFVVSSLPTLPYQVGRGQNFSFQIKFAPRAVGPLSSSVILNTTQQAQGFAVNTPIQLKGTGQSQAPLLAISPNTVSFNGVITGQNVGGVNQSAIINNAGNMALQVTSIQYSVVGEKGPWTTANGTQSARQVSAFTFYNLPASIPANGGITIPINFNPTTSGAYAVFVQVNSDGGSKLFNVLGSGSDIPRALIEFESPNGSWIRYTNSTPFNFGNVTENTSRNLRLRLTNVGSVNAAPISLTVSKPPFGIPGSIIGSSNQVDLGEGTLVYANQSVTASMYCAVPKSQINVQPYFGTANWTINLNDPTFGKQQLHFICTAVSEQAPPLDSSSQAIYRYAGCFKENNPGRQLQTQIYSADSNTNGMCIAQCATAGYIFAGTQYNSQCWCGYNRPKLVTSEQNCNFPCPGNVNELCGGNGVDGAGAYISTFGDDTRWNGNSTDVPGPYVNPGVLGYRSAGCYTEGTGVRALSVAAQGNKTVATCLKACQGYTYAGVEYGGGECYCDNKLGVGSVNASASDCSMTCNNNQTEYCGGPSRLNMYVFGNGTAPTNSAAAFSSTSSSPSTTTSTPAGPSIPPTIGKFSYLSCYTEGTTGRALGDFTQADNTISLTKCASLCPQFQYFGVEYGRECYCGNVLGTGSVPATDGRCNMNCAGNANQICGGPNGLQLYTASSNTSSTISSSPTPGSSNVTSASVLPATATTFRSTFANSTTSTSLLATTTTSSTTTTSATPTGPTTVPSVAGFKYLGCYTEGTNIRALTDKALASSDMTPQNCASNCTSFTFMAVEYSQECYCGNTLMGGSVPATDGRCSMTCGGNAGQVCGGPNGLSLYQFSAANTSSTTTSSSTTTLSLASSTLTTTTRSSSSSSTLMSSLSGSFTTPSFNASTSTSSSSLTSTTRPTSTVNLTSTNTQQSPTSASVTSTSRSFSTVMTALGSQSANSTLATLTRSSTTFSTTTSTSTITTTSSAISIPTSSPWQYLSCYAEMNPRLLGSASTTSNTMTVSTCQSFCLARNLPLAGLQYSRECWCGSTLASTAQANQTGCNMPCSGNATEICGGGSRLSVYNYSLYSAPQHKPTIQGYNFQGCYTDVGLRTLDKYTFSAANMTQEACVGACGAKGYKFAGAEYGSQCWCGDGINVSADGKGGAKVGEGDCGMLCGGDRGEWCGSGNRLSVWAKA